jgi:hypothetical protein
MVKVSRSEVYAAIDSERIYQDHLWGDQMINPPSIDAFACYVQGYTNQLVEKCSTSEDVDARLNFFRKVAGLCVACMEQHGAPSRYL